MRYKRSEGEGAMREGRPPEGWKDRRALKGRGEGWTRVSSCREHFKGDGDMYNRRKGKGTKKR